MARRIIVKCDICGKEYNSDTTFLEYALTRADNSGMTLVEFDSCPECLDKVIKAIKSLFLEE